MGANDLQEKAPMPCEAQEFRLVGGIGHEYHPFNRDQRFSKKQNSRKYRESLWAVLNLFGTTSFPIPRGKYGSIVLLFGILAVCNEIVKKYWCYLSLNIRFEGETIGMQLLIW